MNDIEVAVVGGGAMGAAAAWQLARRGRDVVVFEQFERGHDRGSSHGSARIFRLAYTTGDYLSFALEALELWRELEAESGRTLLQQVGSVDHGHPGEIAAIGRELAAAGIDHERLSPEQAAERWPGMRFDRDVVFHPQGGRTDAGATVAAALDAAIAHGATVQESQPVERLEVAGDGVVVHSTSGPHRARQAVVTVGAWARTLLAGHVTLPPITVTQEQPAHFRPVIDADWPAFLHYADGPAKTAAPDDRLRAYGLPTPEGAMKIGEHHTGPAVDPDRRPGSADPERLARLQRYVGEWFPGLDTDRAAAETCLYTTTATTDFVLDRAGPLVIGAGFSGHGFKFVPRVGQALADMVDGAPSPRSRFRLPASTSNGPSHQSKGMPCS